MKRSKHKEMKRNKKVLCFGKDSLYPFLFYLTHYLYGFIGSMLSYSFSSSSSSFVGFGIATTGVATLLLVVFLPANCPRIQVIIGRFRIISPMEDEGVEEEEDTLCSLISRRFGLYFSLFPT
jgi:uncharacterized phage infection (PIP) family protein YhgE